MKKIDLTDEHIDLILRRIKELLAEGYSISLATKLTCGCSCGRLACKVRLRSEYFVMLNEYIKKKHPKLSFQILDGRIKQKKHLPE